MNSSSFTVMIITMFSIIIILLLLISSSSSTLSFVSSQQQQDSNSSTTTELQQSSTSTTSTTVTPPPPKRRTLTKSQSRSQSSHCGYFELFFGVPHFATQNISLKEAVAHESFPIPIFITLLAHIENGIIKFNADDFITTHWINDPTVMTASVDIVTGNDVVSIPNLRRRVNFNREAVSTWVIRPPKDMLENVGVAVEIRPDAFYCALTWASIVPVGHVLLERRYSTSQVFFVRGMLTLGDVVSFITAASSVSMVGHALQRSHILALYFMCEVVDDMWFSNLENPMQMEIGDYNGSRPRGALIGNILFCFIIYVSLNVLAVCVTFWRRRKNLRWSWKRCFSLPEPQVDYKYLPLITKIKTISQDAYRYYLPKKSKISVRLPGLMFIPFSFVTMGTARAATELLRRAINAFDIFLGLVGFIFMLGGLYYFYNLVINRTRRETVSWIITVPEKDKKLESRFDRICEFVRYNSFRFTTSPAAWFSRAQTGEIKGGVAVTRSGGRIRDETSSSSSDEDLLEQDRFSDEEGENNNSNNNNSSRNHRVSVAGQTQYNNDDGNGNDSDEDSIPDVGISDEERKRLRKLARQQKRKKNKKKNEGKKLGESVDEFLKQKGATVGIEGGLLSSNGKPFERKFVEKYGSLFDAFTTIGYYWASVDVVTAMLMGIFTGIHPALNSISCAVTLLFIATLLSVYLACLCLAKPWASLHNRFFALAFATCNVFGIGINLLGTYFRDRSLQERADTLDLVTNGIALLKLFFDMVSLLLLPSLSGFFGYVFGSTSYQMMRQHAWAAEMKRREDESAAATKKKNNDVFDNDEEEEEEEEQKPMIRQQKKKEPEEEEENRDPNKRYRVVRTVRVVRRIYKPPPVDVTPVGSENGEDDEEMDLQLDDDDQQQQIPSAVEAEEEEEEQETPSMTESELERKRRKMSSLQRFMMI